MNILLTVCSAVLSLVSLFLFTRLLGYRQVSELSVFDYINGITIGSIAAEMAIGQPKDALPPLIAMAVYTGGAVLLSVFADRSTVLRRLIVGSPKVMYRNGRFYKENFKRQTIDVGELMMQCRSQGYFDMAEIDTVVLEPNGKISILPKSEKKPATPKDLGVQTAKASIPANVILDGAVMEENLRALGFDRVWLDRALKMQNAPKASEIFLATADKDGTLSVYPIADKLPKDILT